MQRKVEILDLAYAKPISYITKNRQVIERECQLIQDQNNFESNIWASMWEWRKFGKKLKNGENTLIRSNESFFLGKESYFNIFHESQVQDDSEFEVVNQ